MPEEIVMPRLSDTMEEGTIAQWLKREGEAVRKGEPILEVETDKANMELQAYSDGVIQQIIQGDGATVPIGTVVGILARAGEESAQPQPAQSQPTQSQPTQPQPAQPQPAEVLTASAETPLTDVEAGEEEDDAGPAGKGAPAGRAPVALGGDAPATGNGAAATTPTVNGGRVKASPLARNLARQHDIDLVALSGHGSGPGGRIVREDIEHYLVRQGGAAAPVAPPAGPPQALPAAAPTATPEAAPVAASAAPATGPATAPPASMSGADVELRKPNRIQQVMARRLLESKTTVPHFYVTSEVDMAAAADLRKQLLATFGDGGKVSYNDLVVRACALALRATPEVNTSWRDGQFAVHQRVNVGIAVSLPEGLVVPVIKDADRKGVREIAVEARALADKARSGKLAPTDMEGGTFTVSNLGMYDIEEFQAIINPPESAILAVGSILDKPVAMDGAVVVRPRMRLTLSVDHRVVPGVPAVQFLRRVKQLLQEPLRLGF